MDRAFTLRPVGPIHLRHLRNRLAGAGTDDSHRNTRAPAISLRAKGPLYLASTSGGIGGLPAAPAPESRQSPAPQRESPREAGPSAARAFRRPFDIEGATSSLRARRPFPSEGSRTHRAAWQSLLRALATAGRSRHDGLRDCRLARCETAACPARCWNGTLSSVSPLGAEPMHPDPRTGNCPRALQTASARARRTSLADSEAPPGGSAFPAIDQRTRGLP